MGKTPSDIFVESVLDFSDFGSPTHVEPFEWEVNGEKGMTLKATNEYWTSRQRQAHSLHEISYRACYKPQLPRFFIERLSQPGDAVYDPFMGRGTTQMEAYLLGRRPLGNDINPLSRVLLAPRLSPPRIEDVKQRLDEIDLGEAKENNLDLLAFYHAETLKEIIALKEYFLKREQQGKLDSIDAWIRMVAINRLSGHSPGFFSVYTLPPNQAVSVKRQLKINETREQIPEYKDIRTRIMKKSKSLLKDWNYENSKPSPWDLTPHLTNSNAESVLEIATSSTQLVVTSPPFLDIVDYQADNWLRCWFIDVDSSKIQISQLKGIEQWENTMSSVLSDLKRIVKPGGFIAFEVGEVRGGTVLLEENALHCGVRAGLEPVLILINAQEFTKTANAWGVDNKTKGTNTNRIVVFHRK